MKDTWQRAAVLLTCAAIAGCGGGGATHGSASGNTAVGLSFLIPSASSVASNGRTVASGRAPAFISTLTTSIAVTVFPANAPQPSSPTTVANVGPGVAGCTTATAGTTCIVTVDAPTGNDTFIVSAFSGQNGTGSLLSQATVTQGVSVGMGAIALTLTATGARVTGDMLGYVANRTWTYTVNSGSVGVQYGLSTDLYSGYTGYGVGGGPFVVGIYADPQVTGGITTLVAFVAPIGTSNPFSPIHQVDAPFIVGAMGVQSQANGYLVSSYGSVANNSFGLVPGTPMLVPSTLQLGQSWNPLTNAVASMVLGVSAVATVTAVGQVPGIALCPGSPAQGATVRYTIAPIGAATTNSSVSYVPGCGITDYIASTGTEFMLSAVGSQNLGNLDVARKTQSATLLGTLHTLWQHIFVKHGI